MGMGEGEREGRSKTERGEREVERKGGREERGRREGEEREGEKERERGDERRREGGERGRKEQREKDKTRVDKNNSEIYIAIKHKLTINTCHPSDLQADLASQLISFLQKQRAAVSSQYSAKKVRASLHRRKEGGVEVESEIGEGGRGGGQGRGEAEARWRLCSGG